MLKTQTLNPLYLPLRYVEAFLLSLLRKVQLKDVEFVINYRCGCVAPNM